MSARLAIRLGAAVVSAVVAVGAFVPPGVAASPSAVGRVSLDDGATATRFATATVTVVPPSGPASLLRVSNDGGSTWVERSYATSFTWSLVDPAAGGTEVDGQKTVTVEAGDGVGPWASLGADAILLDRAPPSVGGESAVPRGWRMTSEAPVGDTGAGLLRAELSLDGVHWRTLLPRPRAYDAHPAGYFDFREGVIGGSWATGERHYFLRGIDRVGNVSETRDFSVVVEAAWDVDDIPGLVMTYPLPAITGHPFTVNPVWDSSYRVPAGYVCRWSLVWQSEATYFGGPKDEDYGRVSLSRAPKNGRCEAWTFTLPYAPSLLYHVGLSLMGAGDLGVGRTPPGAGTFRAARDGTDRGIASSNLPLYYIVPNRGLVPAGGSVTYHLESAGTSTLPNTGVWACRPSPVPPDMYYPPTQRGGTSFTCPVDRPGAWVAEWTWWPSETRYFRAEYDPVSDRAKPTVGTPIVRVGTAASPSPTYPPVSISWSGRDVGTGISRYTLQRSINGGPYLGVPLASARATGIDLRLGAGRTYRFRVRARDRAGNWSGWAYSAPVRAFLYQESSSAFAWSSGWTRRLASGASGGAVRDATVAGRSATFRFSGRGVGWFARKGPGNGFAQVRVDGVLVATVNLESATAQPPRVLWRQTWAATRAHVVQVRLLGTAGRPRVEVDAFEVLR